MMYFGGLDEVGSDAYVLWGVAAGFLACCSLPDLRPVERQMRPYFCYRRLKYGKNKQRLPYISFIISKN
ncbi:hypothetical protein YWY31_07020 [Paenibacillus illinoisensis]